MPTVPASVFQQIQVGVESTLGTLVTGSKLLSSLQLDINPMEPTKEVRPEGQKYAVGSIVGKNWVEAALASEGDFNLPAYLFSSLISAATITTPASNGAHTWTITGTPTGGTFTATYKGQTTGTIAYNAAAATVQTALEALSTIGTGNVLVGGGPGPGTPWTVTLRAAMQYDPALFTFTPSFTGGSSPAIASTTTAASLTRRWTWTSAQGGPDTPKGYTFEKGSSVSASRFGYGLITDLEWAMAENQNQFKGKVLGRAIVDAWTMTGSPTTIAQVPISPKYVSLYAGGTVLGMTQVTSLIDSNWFLKGRYKPVFTQDASQTSYTAHVEAAAQLGGQITVWQDSVAEGYLTDLRNMTSKFIRWEAVGQNIETGFPYRLRITMPFRFSDPKRGNKNDQYTSTFGLIGAYDSGLASAIEVVLDCGLTAL